MLETPYKAPDGESQEIICIALNKADFDHIGKMNKINPELFSVELLKKKKSRGRGWNREKTQ